MIDIKSMFTGSLNEAAAYNLCTHIRYVDGYADEIEFSFDGRSRQANEGGTRCGRRGNELWLMRSRPRKGQS